MGPWAPTTTFRTVEHVPTTPTNRFYPLPDGRDLTWSHWPVENATGQVIVSQHTDGHVDGAPIADDELHVLLHTFGVH